MNSETKSHLQICEETIEITYLSNTETELRYKIFTKNQSLDYFSHETNADNHKTLNLL